MIDPFKPLEFVPEERNIFVRIGLTRGEWDKLGDLGVGRPHEAAEKVLEFILPCLERALKEGEFEFEKEALDEKVRDRGLAQDP